MLGKRPRTRIVVYPTLPRGVGMWRLVQLRWVALCLVLCSWPITGHAFDPNPKHSLVLNTRSGIQLNPLGLLVATQLGYRYRLFNSQSRLLRGSYIQPSLLARVTPAFTNLGASLTVQPIAVLKLTASYQYLWYFGSFNQIFSAADSRAEYHDDRVKDLTDTAYRGKGHKVTLQASLRAKVGPVAVISDLTAYYHNMQLSRGDTVWYDQFLDVLAPRVGFVLRNDTTVLWVTKLRMLLGARYTMIHSFYRGETGKNLNTPTHRIGPSFGYAFRTQHKWFHGARALFGVQWWLKHRYRTGQQHNAALPYFVLGITFNSQVLKL
jgi:hypothetical protein